MIHTITPNGMMDKSWNSLATGVNVRMMIPESHDKLRLNKKTYSRTPSITNLDIEPIIFIEGKNLSCKQRRFVLHEIFLSQEFLVETNGNFRVNFNFSDPAQNIRKGRVHTTNGHHLPRGAEEPLGAVTCDTGNIGRSNSCSRPSNNLPENIT